jgi:chlorobactene glucosyltransferase
MSVLLPLLLTLPWTLLPIVGLIRATNTRSLDDVPADVPADAPLVSVIIPARNEIRNIERCARSVLSAAYPSLEVIVVNDHSTDGTGDAARAIAAEDSRLRVVEAPDLPDGWFGKQWACTTGASAARGTLLLFTDADTWHASDLLPRSVNAFRMRNADLFSVAPHQEMHSFWERVIQPIIFGLLSIRYGGLEHVSNTRNPMHVIANGQFILVRRDVYDAMRGHERVKDCVAEDLALAQEWVRAGRTLVMMVALRQMSTHMYASLGEVIGGWRKNIFAGGRNAAMGGRLGVALFPLVLVATPLFGLAPVIALVLAALGVLPAAWLIWSATIVVVALVFWGVIYHAMGENPLGAVLFPLGLALLFYIAVGAVWRGQRVQWKERDYVSR